MSKLKLKKFVSNSELISLKNVISDFTSTFNISASFNSVQFLLRYWIDTADKQPCVGTGGMIPWKLQVTGKLFHSGLAHKVCSYIIAYNHVLIF